VGEIVGSVEPTPPPDYLAGRRHRFRLEFQHVSGGPWRSDQGRGYRTLEKAQKAMRKRGSWPWRARIVDHEPPGAQKP
jgi:hypothetical protein